MEKKQFARRMSQLRQAKGVSARDMSLSLGQSAGYINNIENNVSMPSMDAFFMICDFLEITPKDFFDVDQKSPGAFFELMEKASRLTPRQLQLVNALVDEIISN